MKNSVIIGRFGAVPLALLLTLSVQAGAAIWWISAKARDNFFLEQRVEVIETVLSHSNERTVQISERLIRIEERLKAQTILLGRIDKQISINRR